MRVKVLYIPTVLVSLAGMAGCCSWPWCEKHYAQPVNCCQPCTPCCQSPVSTPAPSYSPCTPCTTPAGGSQWVQPQPVPQH
jgi:hypothetical protein